MSDKEKMSTDDRVLLVNTAIMLKEFYEGCLNDPNSLLKFSDKERYSSYVNQVNKYVETRYNEDGTPKK